MSNTSKTTEYSEYFISLMEVAESNPGVAEYITILQDQITAQAEVIASLEMLSEVEQTYVSAY